MFDTTGTMMLDNLTIVKNTLTYYWTKIFGWKYAIYTRCDFGSEQQKSFQDWCLSNCSGNSLIQLSHISKLGAALVPYRTVSIHFDNKNDLLLAKLYFTTIDEAKYLNKK